MSVEEFEAFVARSTNGSSYVNTLRPGLEHRLIAWLQGKQFHNDEIPDIIRIPDVLLVPGSQRRWRKFGLVSMRNHAALPLVDHGNGVYTLINAEQGVHYTLIVRQKKSELEEYMRLEDTYLVYAGHARYGRGPCFGTGHGPSEEWEEGGADRENTGLFRMGYPFIPIPRGEVIEHGYTANPVLADTPLAREDCHPDLVPHVRRLKARSAAEIDARLVGRFTDSDPSKRYWTYDDYDLGHREIFLVMHAGWQNTTTHPHELDAVELKCRVFCDFGCSTQKHHHPVLRDFKNWQRDGDDRHAFFTTAVANNVGTVGWLYHSFTYREWSAFQPWEPWLKYTLQRTNRDLGRDGQSYRYR